MEINKYGSYEIKENTKITKEVYNYWKNILDKEFEKIQKIYSIKNEEERLLKSTQFLIEYRDIYFYLSIINQGHMLHSYKDLVFYLAKQLLSDYYGNIGECEIYHYDIQYLSYEVGIGVNSWNGEKIKIDECGYIIKSGSFTNSKRNDYNCF